MMLNVKQIAAIHAGRALAETTSTEVLAAALVNAIANDARVSHAEGAQLALVIGALFSALTAEAEEPKGSA